MTDKEQESVVKIKTHLIVPSAAYAVKKSDIKQYSKEIRTPPKFGDLVFCEVIELGHHKSLESNTARSHTLNVGTRAVFVMGSRYAPDQFEAYVPETYKDTVEIFSQGGIVGDVRSQNAQLASPTKVRVLGYIVDKENRIINTKNYNIITPKKKSRKGKGAKIILCVGTAMNSGKTYAAAACCYSLSSMNKDVRASKITGTASLKDPLLMNDCGAKYISDFTYQGYPSTFKIGKEELFNIFNNVDMKYGNNPKNYLVLEFADGIFQRETAMLLKMPEVQSRIHKLVFCASDSTAIYGGIEILKKEFGLTPDAISGVISSSPLAIEEVKTFTDIPVFESMEKNYKTIFDIIA